jgi:antitoxin VapB
MHVAKVFRNGRSQAIRLPKDFRVETDQVYLKKTAEGFVVILRDPWEIFFEGVDEMSDDFMTRG